MNRYIEEIGTVNGVRTVISIFYFEYALIGLTFGDLLADRKEVFGHNWLKCIAQKKDGIYHVTLRKCDRRCRFKAESLG